MKTQIQIDCPDCHSPSFSIHGKKSYGKQNYQCKDCKRQFIGDHALTYNGCHSRIEDKIRLMTVRGCGISRIAVCHCHYLCEVGDWARDYGAGSGDDLGVVANLFVASISTKKLQHHGYKEYCF